MYNGLHDKCKMKNLHRGKKDALYERLLLTKAL